MRCSKIHLVVGALWVGVLASCGARAPLSLSLSAPLFTPMILQDLKDELARVDRPVRRGLRIERAENTEEPIVVNGWAMRPILPRLDAIEHAIQELEREDQPLFVVAPNGDTARRAEAEAARELGATIVMVRDVETSEAIVQTLRNAGIGADELVLLLLRERSPEIARSLLAAMPALRVVIEGLFESSVARLRDAAIPLAGAIVFDLAGTINATDTYTNGENRVLNVPAVFRQ